MLARRTAWLLAAAVWDCPHEPAAAQQALNISLGYFAVTGEDARTDGDVLVANREILAFDVDDFNTGSVGLEWLLPVGEFLEVGAGAAFTSQHGPQRLRRTSSTSTAPEIEQDMKLRSRRLRPRSASCRSAGPARCSRIMGGGIGFFSYRYSEVGDFVDFTDHSVFTAVRGRGTELGAVALAGIRFPITDNWSLGGEVRWQKADADL